MQTKVAIFDFDGTLTKSGAGGNCWRYVWEKIGKTEVDNQLYGQFLRGDFDGDEWSRRVINEYRLSFVSKEIIDEVASKLVLREGIKETFELLKAAGVKIYIFSGGIKQMIIQSLGDLASLVDDIECEELLFDENGIVCGSNTAKFDTEDKQHFVRELASRHKIAPDQIFFTGNGRNDETAHRAGAITLCINPDDTDPHNKNIWDYYIENITSLQEILQFLK